MVPRKILDALITKQVVEPGRKHCIHYIDENGKESKCTLAKMTKDRAFFVEEPRWCYPAGLMNWKGRGMKNEKVFLEGIQGVSGISQYSVRGEFSFLY